MELKELVLEYLSQTKNGSANVEEISSNGFNFEILPMDLESILEDLEHQKLIKLHKHDRVVILDAGREFLKEE